MTAIPIVVCGRSPAIAQIVKAGLAPEYEVIHTIQTPNTGISEIPALLRGASLFDTSNSNIGTKNYSRPPVAIVCGGSYDDEHVQAMREACDGGEGGGALWLSADVSVDMPPLGPEYGKATVTRVRRCLGELLKGRVMGFGKVDRVYFY